MSHAVTDIARRLANLIGLGTIAEVDPSVARVRVTLNGRLTDWLPLPAPIGRNAIGWHPPRVGAQVLVACPGGDPANAVIVQALYSADCPAPSDDPALDTVRFEDGTQVTYDSEAHELRLALPAEGARVIVECAERVTIDAPAIDLGNADALEPVVLGDQLARWVADTLKPWLDGHTHVSAKAGQPTSSASKVAPFEPGAATADGAVYSRRNRSQ
nr:phage baseplate assembly protein V [Rhodothalassium salexigens]